MRSITHWRECRSVPIGRAIAAGRLAVEPLAGGGSGLGRGHVHGAVTVNTVAETNVGRTRVERHIGPKIVQSLPPLRKVPAKTTPRLDRHRPFGRIGARSAPNKQDRFIVSGKICRVQTQVSAVGGPDPSEVNGRRRRSCSGGRSRSSGDGRRCRRSRRRCRCCRRCCRRRYRYRCNRRRGGGRCCRCRCRSCR